MIESRTPNPETNTMNKQIQELASALSLVLDGSAAAFTLAREKLDKLLAEPEPEYRPLEEGEIIREGDEYLPHCSDEWRKTGCVGDAFQLTLRGGKHFPHRRPIANDSIISEPEPQYRILNPGERIQEGDEYSYGDGWEATRNAGGSVITYRRRIN